MRMCHIDICGQSSFTIFSHTVSQRFDFQETNGHKRCVLNFSRILYEKLLILGRIQRVIIINIHRSLSKVKVALLVFFRRSFKEKSNIAKLRLLEAELLHADRQTNGRTENRRRDLTKLIVNFDNFSNEPKMSNYTF